MSKHLIISDECALIAGGEPADDDLTRGHLLPEREHLLVVVLRPDASACAQLTPHLPIKIAPTNY